MDESYIEMYGVLGYSFTWHAGKHIIAKPEMPQNVDSESAAEKSSYMIHKTSDYTVKVFVAR